MKILQLCKKFPYPFKDGESIAVTTLSRALAQLGCELSMLAMNTSKHYFDVKKTPPQLNYYREIQTVGIDNRIRIRDAFLNLFSKESYHISRFISGDFRKKLIRLLKENEYEVIQLETLYLAPYIPVIRQYSGAIVSMRAHNVEHEIWERISSNTTFFPKRWYLNHLTTKLKAYEVAQLKLYDILVPISSRDLSTFQSMRYRSKAQVTPIGLDSRGYQPDYSSYRRPLSISFIGSLDWMPNQEGLKWFLDGVWPVLRRQFPALQLHVAGRNTPEWLYRLRQKNIVVHGEVPDARSFINQHSLMVVPLLSGSGMRAKILESMALGKVVLSTTLGLEGIPARDGKEVFVADHPKAFAEIIRHCYQNRKILEHMGRKARHFVVEKYDSMSIAQQLLDVYESLAVRAF
jgi:glycosyltransferase involved in cell wall biosynthesis